MDKDMEFKTTKLNEFLKDNNDKSTQIYELRKNVIERDANMKVQYTQIESLSQQLGHFKLNNESNMNKLTEMKEQLTYMTQQ